MRDTTRSVVVAALGILAVAFAAATLDSSLVDDTGSGGASGASGDGGGGLLPAPQASPEPGGALQIPYLAEFVTLLAAVVALVLVAYVLFRWRSAARILLAGVALAALGYLFAQVLVLPSRPPQAPAFELGNSSLIGGGGGGAGDSGGSQSTPPAVLVLVGLALAIAGAVVAAVRTGSDDEDEDDPGAAAGEDAAAVGRAAGRAADRIEDAGDADNDVYRAWREMTGLLDVADPETSTPGEFAAAAVDAGLEREDVTELTRLFEDVRYGDRAASAAVEERAADVFRRIEAQYAEDDP
jgi:hypothetical protein